MPNYYKIFLLGCEESIIEMQSRDIYIYIELILYLLLIVLQ